MKALLMVATLLIISSIFGCKKKEEAMVPAPYPAAEQKPMSSAHSKYPIELPAMRGPKKQGGVE